MKAFTKLINTDTGNRRLHVGARGYISIFENILQPKQLSESPLLRSIRTRNSTTAVQDTQHRANYSAGNIPSRCTTRPPPTPTTTVQTGIQVRLAALLLHYASPKQQEY